MWHRSAPAARRFIQGVAVGFGRWWWCCCWRCLTCCRWLRDRREWNGMAVRFAFLCNLWSDGGRYEGRDAEERVSSSCCLPDFFIWSPVNGMFWFRAAEKKGAGKGKEQPTGQTTKVPRRRARKTYYGIPPGAPTRILPLSHMCVCIPKKVCVAIELWRLCVRYETHKDQRTRKSNRNLELLGFRAWKLISRECLKISRK